MQTERLVWRLLTLGAFCGLSACVVYTNRAPRHSGRQARSHRPPPPAPARTPATAQPAAAPAPAAQPVAAKPQPTFIKPPPSMTAPAQPPKEEPPHSSGRPQVLPEGAPMGRPAGFKAGAAAAYWIWLGPRGGWRVRTTTGESSHVFRGHVHALTGPPAVISSVQPTRTEFSDRIWKTKTGWAFSFKTSGHADGFSFLTRDPVCVVFDLQLDGGPEPKRVFVGREQVEPQSGFFVACPKGVTPALR